MGLFSFLTQEIAIDLGTANTLIIWNDKVVVDEPSIVARIFKPVRLLPLEERRNKCMVKPIVSLKRFVPSKMV